MSGITLGLGKEPIEPVLGQRVGDQGNLETEIAKVGRADEHQQRLDRLDAALEIFETLPDEIAAGQVVEGEGLGCHGTAS